MAVKLISNSNNYAGLSSDVKPATAPEGSTFHVIDTGEKYIRHNGTWELDLSNDLSGLNADIATVKAQNQIAKPAEHSFAFDATLTAQNSAIDYNGMVKHLHLVVPNFTNVVTATVTLVDASGRTLWTSAAKAKNASYNLESETEWLDQLVDSTLTWTVTLSGAAGGTGGPVVLVPRYYGV